MRTTSISNVKQGSAGGKGALYEETCMLVLYYLCSQVPTRIYTCNKASFFCIQFLLLFSHLSRGYAHTYAVHSRFNLFIITKYFHSAHRIYT